MPDQTMTRIFALIGFAFCVACLVMMGIVAFYFVKDGVQTLIHKYKMKNRFEKPPTAACYCKDCKKWNPKNGDCDDPCNSRSMGEAWFCYFADPMTKEEAEKREKEKLNDKN